jgi:hypothetical protein
MRTKSFIPFLCFFFSLPAFSQIVEPKNMGKINLSALAIKSIGLQYERQIGKHFTAALGYSNIPKSSPAFSSFIQEQIDDESVNVKDFKIGTSIFTPEVRYYVSKKGAFHGFYLAPYARIGHYDLEGPVSYTTSTGFTRNAFFTGKLNTVTGGLMIGSNFRLSDRVHLDWWILGASIGGGDGNFVAATPLSSDEQTALKDQLDSVDIPFTTIQSTVNATGATITTTGNMAGVRGLGINIGIRF